MSIENKIFRKFVPLCPCLMTQKDTHELCVICLEACSILEGAEWAHCEFFFSEEALLSLFMMATGWAGGGVWVVSISLMSSHQFRQSAGFKSLLGMMRPPLQSCLLHFNSQSQVLGLVMMQKKKKILISSTQAFQLGGVGGITLTSKSPCWAFCASCSDLCRAIRTELEQVNVCF